MKESELSLRGLQNQMLRWFGPRGLTMHRLYTSIMAQEAAAEEKKNEWSTDEGTELTPIDDNSFTRSFPQRYLDRIKQISPEELEELRENPFSDPHEIEPNPDFTRPGGHRNDNEWLPNDDHTFIINPDGWMRRRNPLECGQVWHLHLYMGRPVPNCHAANYEALYNELLKRGMAEAHLACASTNCEVVKAWIFNSLWECNRVANGFEEQCIIELAVVCVAA